MIIELQSGAVTSEGVPQEFLDLAVMLPLYRVARPFYWLVIVHFAYLAVFHEVIVAKVLPIL